VPLNDNDDLALAELDIRLKTVLPQAYQESYETVQPTPMGSAGLKFDDTGQVAWDDIWKTFCDLAMAGGPPHKGRLLEPATASEIQGAPDRYDEVVGEICRGVEMVTSMPCEPAPDPGWVRVECYTETMAAWLLRAIVMENVAARADGLSLDLPASPAFRLEKEIKNVVTVIAKTCHYWDEHMPRSQQRAIAALFAVLARESPLVAPSWTGPGQDAAPLAAHIERLTGLRASSPHTAGWLGLECQSVRAAVWMMRGLVVMNVLSRREETVLFVPINAGTDPTGARVAAAVARIHRLATRRLAGAA
jgi:sirohydrochlorin cobaltochelatase